MNGEINNIFVGGRNEMGETSYYMVCAKILNNTFLGSDENISLPQPGDLSETFQVAFGNQRIHIGKGIHDSSASLAPYILASREPFVIVSTGTWCVSMNPFNEEPLSDFELENDFERSNTLEHFGIGQPEPLDHRN